MYEALANLGDTNNQIVIWSDEDMAEDGISNSFPSSGYPALLHWSWVRVFNHNEEGTPMNWLFKQVKKEPVDKEPLEKLVSTAKKVDVSKLTDESKKLYTEAVGAAEKVLNDENATAEDVQSIYEKLSTVLDNLKIKEESVDKEALEKLVSTAKEVDVSKLTDESKKLYTDTVAAAEKVLNDENATAEDVQNVYEKLSTVLDNLKEKTINNSEPKVDVKNQLSIKKTKRSSQRLKLEIQ